MIQYANNRFTVINEISSHLERFRCSGTSMSPFLCEGDELWVHPVKGEELKRGAVYLFRFSDNNPPIAHRFRRKECLPEGEIYCFSSDQDPLIFEYIRPEQLLGKVEAVRKPGGALASLKDWRLSDFFQSLRFTLFSLSAGIFQFAAGVSALLLRWKPLRRLKAGLLDSNFDTNITWTGDHIFCEIKSREKCAGFCEGILRSPQIAEVKNMEIRRRYRSAGLAKKILHVLLTNLSVRAVQKIRLEVWENNRDAITLYASAGFKRIGATQHTSVRWKQPRTFWVMEKSLDDVSCFFHAAARSFIHDQPLEYSLDFFKNLDMNKFESALKEKKMALILYHLLSQNPSLKSTLADPLLAALKNSYLVALQKTTLQQQALREFLSLCQAARLPVILLRGQALGEYYYPDPALRTSWDADLLIRPDDLAQLDQLCRQLGYKKRLNHGEIGYYRDSAIPLHLDIHTELWYQQNPQEIWEASKPRVFHGVPVLTLGSEDLFIHLIAHAAMHHARFSDYDAIDLGRVLRQEPLDWEKVYSRIQGSHLETVCHMIASRLQDHDALPVSDSFVRRTRPKRHQHWRLKFYRNAIKPYDQENIGHFLRPLCRPGFFPKLQFVWNYVFPDDDFIKHRYGVQHPLKVFSFKVLRPFSLTLRIFVLAWRWFIGYNTPS